MAPINPEELARWEQYQTERSRFLRVAFGFYYNYAPKMLGWSLSIPGLVFGTVRGLLLLMMGLLPVWIKFYDKSTTLSWGEALVLSGIIALALLYNHWYDRIVKEYKPKKVKTKLTQKLSLELCGMISGFSGSVKLKAKEHRPSIDLARKHVLQCIRNVTQIHLSDYEGTEIEATLWLFEDEACKRMKIVDRTTAARPTGKVVNSEEVMAFYVARSRKHRAVNDFLNDNHPFPKAGLSADKPPYRSILLIPLLDTASGSPDTCVGVVTIDSSRPYHFWPGGGGDLVVALAPYCTWLMLLLSLSKLHRLHCAS